MSVDRRTMLTLAGTTGLFPSAAAHRSVEPRPADRVAHLLRLTDYMTPAMLADVQAGTLRVDCAPALQAALDAASGRGLSSLQTGQKLLIPAGRYLLTQPVSLSWRNAQGVIDDGDMRRVSIEGDGQANTVLFYRGDPAQPAVQVHGFKSPPGQGDGVSLRLTLSGLQLIRDLSTRHRGTGLSLNGAALIRLMDMEVSSFDLNIELIDTLRVYMESVHINGGNIGLQARGRNFSNPNVYKLVHCSVSGNTKNGLHIVGGCNISLDTCAMEGNGHDDKRAVACIFFEDGPSQGGCAGHIDNCYFENNFVVADVLVNWKDNTPGTIKITACSFQRTNIARASTHHLLLSSQSAKLLAHIDCCAFKSFGDYTPSTDRVAVQSNGNVEVSWTANLFQNFEEAPFRRN